MRLENYSKVEKKMINLAEEMCVPNDRKCTESLGGGWEKKGRATVFEIASGARTYIFKRGILPLSTDIFDRLLYSMLWSQITMEMHSGQGGKQRSGRTAPMLFEVSCNLSRLLLTGIAERVSHLSAHHANVSNMSLWQYRNLRSLRLLLVFRTSREAKVYGQDGVLWSDKCSYWDSVDGLVLEDPSALPLTLLR